MKFVAQRADLVEALGSVSRVIASRSTIPILSNLLLRASGDRLSLQGTDLDIEITTSIAAQVEQAGATTVPGDIFTSIVRKLPTSAEISIQQVQTETMTVRSGRARFTLQTLPETDFPNLSASEMPTRFVMPAESLCQAIDQAAFAISTEETRYYLNGIYWHVAQADQGVLTMRMVATDGHRLARIDLALPDGAEGMPGVIVPKKSIAEIRRLLEGTTEPVEFMLSDRQIRLEVGSVRLTSKLIDGTFPDYQRVIPTGNEKRLTIPRSDLARAVDRVMVVAQTRETGRAVKLSLTDDRLTLSARSPDTGDATEELDVVFDNGPFEIGFNGRYVGDVLGALDGDTTLIEFADPGSPTIFRSGTDSPALFVLMPMRV